MQICILNGSPRKHGNTAELSKPFVEALTDGGAQVTLHPLAEMDIASCKGCYHCQDVPGEYGCFQQDDMHAVAASIISSDIVVLLTPIYTWFCTAELKAVLDRFFGLAKFYRSAEGNLLEGKRIAILATHGYDAAYAADPFVIGIQRMCEHYHMRYEGMFSVRDTDDIASFQTKQAIGGAREFARYLLREKV
ncbi:MAG: flavodoxin family protein [Clostridiales bacterium]|nr:flavodoxin family protein [Clostridiales bacterium]